MTHVVHPRGSQAEPDVLSDDGIVSVIGSGPSLGGDRWVLGRDGRDGDSYTYLEEPVCWPGQRRPSWILAWVTSSRSR
jgi:hypothetical protein